MVTVPVVTVVWLPVCLGGEKATAVGGGRALTGEDLEAEHAGFLEKNRVYKCVVHTIGVGPRHNRGLMRRIARDTGGTYRGIGTN